MPLNKQTKLNHDNLSLVNTTIVNWKKYKGTEYMWYNSKKMQLFGKVFFFSSECYGGR